MKRRFLPVLLAIVGVAAAACNVGNHPAAKPASSTTLRLGYYEDIQSPDPDIQYDIPGLELVNNVYEGLVHYATGVSNKIVPWLATSWTISPDDRVYTFHLRSGVTFHDGTPFNSAAAKASFERRIAIKQGTYYQVQDIKTIATPNPLTLVITLKGTNSAFMDYLASPYGVKMISPTAVREHAIGHDLAQKWLSTHDAGTGPYTITQFTLGQQYVVKAYPKWWGPAPYYKTVIFKLVPDSGNQVLQLRAGGLDILHQQPVPTVNSFKNAPGFQVKVFPTYLKTWIHVNTSRPPFNVAAVRTALGQAINRQQIVSTFFGAYGTVSTQMYPAGMLPPGAGADPQPYDPSKLKAAVAKLTQSERSVNLVYLSGHGADIARISDAVGNELQADGLNVTVREVTVAQLFSYPSQNPATVPQLFIGSENPDSASPDTWARPYMSKGAALNYFNAVVPAADAKMNEGLTETNPAKRLQDYAEAGTLIHDQGTFITLADADDTFIARAGITGFEHQAECTTCLILADLRPSR